MKTCGQVAVDVPECDPRGDYRHITLWGCRGACPVRQSVCKHKVVLWWEGCFMCIPGPTCPAFDSVPNPWADVPGFEDRPWSDETEDALIEVQLERMKRR